VLLTFFWY